MTVRRVLPSPADREAEAARLALAIEHREAAAALAAAQQRAAAEGPAYWRRVRCVTAAGTVLAEGERARELYTFACELCPGDSPVRLERYDAERRQWMAC